MANAAAIAGPLTVGTRVALEQPMGDTYKALVTACDGRAVSLKLLDHVPEGALGEGSVLGVSMPLAWGKYKWLCIVARSRSDEEAEVQLLDGPVFSPSRSDPRVGVTLLAKVRLVGPGRTEQSYPAVVTDLSNWGLKLESAPQLSSGDVIEVTMELVGVQAHSPRTVSILGRVVSAYSNNRNGETPATDAHVNFLDGQEDALQAVSNFVDRQLEPRTASLAAHPARARHDRR